MQHAQLTHTLLGAVEAHATRAEQAYRTAGEVPPDVPIDRQVSGVFAQPADLTQTSLMAFAAVPCHSEADELELLSWRAKRLAGALPALDFSGPTPRWGELGSGDALMRTVRLIAAALSGMTHAAHTADGPQRPSGAASVTAGALDKALAVLEQAADSARHRAR